MTEAPDTTRSRRAEREPDPERQRMDRLGIAGHEVAHAPPLHLRARLLARHLADDRRRYRADAARSRSGRRWLRIRRRLHVAALIAVVLLIAALVIALLALAGRPPGPTPACVAASVAHDAAMVRAEQSEPTAAAPSGARHETAEEAVLDTGRVMRDACPPPTR